MSRSAPGFRSYPPVRARPAPRRTIERTGRDVSLGAVVLNLIGQLRREMNLTVVFVTHDLAAARVVADRIAVMYLGQIVEIGPAEQLIGDPQLRHTAARRLLDRAAVSPVAL